MFDILYRDDDIAVCEKPRGICAEGEREGDMPALLSNALGGASVFAVHRLDRETEGLMVYALNADAAGKLSAQFAERTTVKEYEARIHGVPEATEGEWRDLLFFDRARGRSYVVDRVRRGVKEALLSYRVIETNDGISRVRVRLHTGRTHQIRVQFASRKMPLVGDRRYGAPASGEHLALRACFLSFLHPKTGKRMTFGDAGDARGELS